MSKRKMYAEDKVLAVTLYLDEKGSQKQIATSYGVSQASFQQWIRNYESMGTEAFYRKGYKKYSKKLKLQAVQEYLSGAGSLDDICK